MRYIIPLLCASTALARPALADVPVVVTDIPPVHGLVAAVMEGLGEPVLLLERGASEHAYQMRPSQAGALAEAGLVVWVGPDLTPWLAEALEVRPEGGAILGLLAAEGTFRQDYGDGEKGAHDHGHDDHGHDDHGHDDHAHDDHAHGDHAQDDHAHGDHGHDDHAHGDHAQDDHGHDHGHDHSGTDPHAWLDPANGVVWAGLIAAELSRLDPGNAATYAANATRAAEAIAAAEAEAAALLAPVKDRPFVAFHDAYGYFTGHFGLKMAGTVALGDASAPGAQRLAELRDLAVAGGAVCLFPEAGHDPKLIEQLAQDTGLKVGGQLDPVGTMQDPGPGAYPAVIVTLARVLADCLQG